MARRSRKHAVYLVETPPDFDPPRPWTLPSQILGGRLFLSHVTMGEALTVAHSFNDNAMGKGLSGRTWAVACRRGHFQFVPHNERADLVAVAERWDRLPNDVQSRITQLAVAAIPGGNGNGRAGARVGVGKGAAAALAAIGEEVRTATIAEPGPHAGNGDAAGDVDVHLPAGDVDLAGASAVLATEGGAL